jgi:2-polyprenyl-6-methoxyphenol hydroxylase-like FAD-dependent oxidoreductase
MTESTAASVLIIGAGPVGLMLANLLAQHGVDCRIVTKEPSPRPIEESRAEGNHGRTLALYERLGVLGEAFAQGRFEHSVVLHQGDRRLASFEMQDPQSFYPPLLLTQTRVERILEARLLKAGIIVERGWELTALGQTEEEALATLQQITTGESRTPKATYVAACDGGRSTARSLLGATFEGDSSPTQYALADVKVSTDGEPYDDSMHVWLSPFMMFARVEGEYWRSVAPTDPDHRPDTPDAVLSALQTKLYENGVKLTLHSPRWTSMFRVNTRRVNRMRWGRIFLAGDAAHVHSPMGGQGMNEGMQDALNLSWKLAAVLKQSAADRLLDTYDAERQPIIKALLRETEEMTRFMERPASFVTALRNVAIKAAVNIRPLQPLIRDQFTGASRNMRSSELVSDPEPHAFPGAAPRPGDRAPDAQGLFADGRREARRLLTLWEDAHTHELLMFVGKSETGVRREALSTLAGQIEHRHAGRLRAHVVSRSGSGTANFYLDSLSDLHRRFGADTECAYLIRPDGFIAFRTESLQPETLTAFFQQKYEWV